MHSTANLVGPAADSPGAPATCSYPKGQNQGKTNGDRNSSHRCSFFPESRSAPPSDGAFTLARGAGVQDTTRGVTPSAWERNADSGSAACRRSHAPPQLLTFA